MGNTGATGENTINVTNAYDNNPYYLLLTKGTGTTGQYYISANTLSSGGVTGLNYNPSTGTLNSNAFNAYSDYRIKDNVENIDSRYTTENLRPVTYINKISGKQDIGLIAHELQEEYPFLVTGKKDGSNMQSVNYNGLIGILIKEIQELKNENKLMKHEINNIKNALKL